MFYTLAGRPKVSKPITFISGDFMLKEAVKSEQHILRTGQTTGDHCHW